MEKQSMNQMQVALQPFKGSETVLTVEELQKAVVDIDNMSIDQLEGYGKDTQAEINDTMSGILEESRIIDLGEAGDRLRELADVSKSSKRVLALKGPLASLANMVGRYDKLEEKMDNLEQNVDETVNKLNQTLNNLTLNNNALSDYVKALKEKEESLTEYVRVLEERNDPDQTRLQVAVRRLKDITTLRMMAEQNQVTSLVNLQENKEAARQIADIKTNIIPIIKMQLINKLSSKIAADAIVVKEEIYRYTNSLMVENMQDMSDTADKLIASRESSAYNLENFDKACGMMIDTIERVAKSATTETVKNKEVIRRMQETAKKMNDLVQEQLVGIDDVN